MSSRTGKKHREWSQEDMDAALEDVRINGKSIAEAAKNNNVPRKTLSDRYHKKVKEDTSGGGRPPALSQEHEKDLCGYIEYMAQRGFPLTIHQIKMYAWAIYKLKGEKRFGEQGPTIAWWLGFKARHPESVKLRKADSLDRGRAIFSTVNNLRHYFQLLKGILEEHDFPARPQAIYNCDETIVDLNKSTQKVVVTRRMKKAHSRQVASSEHVTIHCCVSAAGHSIPPFLIYKSAFPGGMYTRGGPEGALYGRQDSGFMDSELFLRWFQKLFVVHARPTAEHPVLLLVDGHSSHCSVEVIEAARENHVVLMALPPHTTHLCQPLDVAVYKSFKTHLSRLVKLGQSLRGNLWIPKSNIARIVTQPFEESMSMSNIKAGFAKCGIHPFNPNALDKDLLFRNSVIPSVDIDLSIPPTSEDETQQQNDEEQQIDPVPGPSSEAIVEPASPEQERIVVRSEESPIKIYVSTGLEPNPAPIIEGNVGIEVVPLQPEEEIIASNSSGVTNPLVKAGIVSPSVADIFFPPDEEIPAGRKRPLRTKSTAQIMSSDEVYSNIRRQRQEIEEKERRKIERQEEAKRKRQNNNEQSRKRANQSRSSTRNKTARAQVEDNDCFVCELNYDRETEGLKEKWVGCDGPNCPHWICPRCLPIGFQYTDDYLCDDCA